jgi:rhodanese-related sulfurtransferase/DNA-binding transcriptional ArsR family regulator
MGDTRHKAALYEQFARVGKALASPKRLELLDLLAQGERSVDDLARAAELGVTSCSAHLQVLHHARLVTTRKQGTRVYYSLASDDVAHLQAEVRDVAARLLAEVEPARMAYLGEDVEMISPGELLRRASSGEVTVLDVRPAAEYAAGHIPGAVSIPVSELAGRLAELPAGIDVAAYCRGPYCVFAHDAVRLLRANGRTARRLSGGMPEWRLAGLPVAVGEAQPAGG